MFSSTEPGTIFSAEDIAGRAGDEIDDATGLVSKSETDFSKYRKLLDT